MRTGFTVLEPPAALILQKLDMPPTLSWMLDQAALYSVARYAERFVPPNRNRRLRAALTGRSLRSFIGGRGNEDEEWQMMVAARSVGGAVQAIS